MAKEPDYSRDIDQSAADNGGDALHQQLDNDQIYEGNDQVKAYTDGLKARDRDQQQVGEEESPDHALARNGKAPRQKGDESSDLSVDGNTSVGGGARGVTQPGLPPDASQLVDNARDHIGGRAEDRIPRASNQATGAQIYGHNANGVGESAGGSHLLPPQDRGINRSRKGKAGQTREQIRRERQEQLQNRLRARRNRERELEDLENQDADKNTRHKRRLTKKEKAEATAAFSIESEHKRNEGARERQRQIREQKAAAAAKDYQQQLNNRVTELERQYAQKRDQLLKYDKHDEKFRQLTGATTALGVRLAKAKLAAKMFNPETYQLNNSGMLKLRQDVDKQYQQNIKDVQTVTSKTSGKENSKAQATPINPNDPKVVQARAMRDALRDQIVDNHKLAKSLENETREYQQWLNSWQKGLANSATAGEFVKKNAKQFAERTHLDTKDVLKSPQSVTAVLQEQLNYLQMSGRDTQDNVSSERELAAQFDKVTKSHSPELRDKLFETANHGYQQLLVRLKNRQKRYFEQSDKISQQASKSNWSDVKPEDRTADMIANQLLAQRKVENLDLCRGMSADEYRRLTQNVGHDKAIEVPKNLPIQVTNAAIQQADGQHNARMLPATISKGAKFDADGEKAVQDSKHVQPNDADLDKAAENAKKVEDAFNNPVLTKYLEQNMQMMKTMQEEIKALHQEINDNSKKHGSRFKKIKHNFAKKHEKMQHVKTGDMLYELAYRGTSRLASLSKTAAKYSLFALGGALHIGGRVNHHAKKKVHETVHAMNEGTIANVDAGLDPAAAQKMQAQHQKYAQKNAKKQAEAQKSSGLGF